MTRTIAAAAAVAIIGLPAAAQAQTYTTQSHAADSRVYGSVGYSQFETDQATLGAVTARVGFKPLRYAGVEIEASAGVDDEAYEVSLDFAPGVIELKHDVAAYAVAFLPLGEHFELFARAGYGTTKVEASTPNVTVQGDGESFNYGAGANVFYGANGLRADWTRRDFTDEGGEADVWSLSYVRRF